MKATFYRDVHDMAGSSQAWYINDILDGIEKGKWRDEVLKVRALYPSHDLKGEEYKKAKHIYQEAKKKLPNFTISGQFTRCENDKLALFSGFIGIDFDALDDIESVYHALANDTYTYALFKSVSGHGICVIVKVEKARFLDAFLGLEAWYMERYGLLVDPSGKNVARRRYVSFDPNCEVVNADSEIFKLYIPKPKTKKPEKPLFFVNTKSDLENLFRQIEDRKVDITGSYDDWFQLGFAFIHEFGEGGLEYFVRASQFHPSFSTAECEKKFATLLRQKPRTVTIAKFYGLCKKAGLDILSDRTKGIAKVVQMQKKAGSSRDSIAETLQKMDSIAPEESKPIIDAVFDSGAVVESEDSVFDKIKMYISRNRPVRFNEIKQRVEFRDTGENVTDAAENGMYIDLKSAVGKEVTKNDLIAYLYSDKIERYNPITEFFEKNKHRRPTGAIQALCNSITPVLNDYASKNLPGYVKYYVTKWLIGAVATIYNDPSPLTLVLTGKGNSGKTEWFRRLLPEELQPYYAETKMDDGKDDKKLLFTKWILMNDEYGGNAKDAKHFKNLSSKKKLEFRTFYGRNDETMQRIAVFCGTSNEDEIVDDPTTVNRRIIPVKVEKINHDLYNSVNKTDLWIEVYHLYKENYGHHLNNEEIKQLSLCTEQFIEHSLERELIEKYYRKLEANETKALERYMSATEVKIFIEKDSMQRVSLKKLGAELKAMGFVQDNKLVQGVKKRGYYLVPTS